MNGSKCTQQVICVLAGSSAGPACHAASATAWLEAEAVKVAVLERPLSQWWCMQVCLMAAAMRWRRVSWADFEYWLLQSVRVLLLFRRLRHWYCVLVHLNSANDMPAVQHIAVPCRAEVSGSWVAAGSALV